jgi:hypothetical protein
MCRTAYLSVKQPFVEWQIEQSSPKLDSLVPGRMDTSSWSPHTGVSVPQNVLTRPQEERIQLAVTAIQGSGTLPNGNPCYSARQAEQHFGVPRSTLGLRLKGIQDTGFFFC